MPAAESATRPDGGASREVERKFLVPVPPAALLAAHPGQALAQGYLAVGGPGSPAEVRVRRQGAKANFLTVKSTDGGAARVEVELPLSAGEFAALWPLTAGRRVEKTRHRLAADPSESGPGLTLEVDVYEGNLAGLVVAEVEFPDGEAAARAFRPPGWFGREVTDDPAYRNAALACHGRPHPDNTTTAESGGDGG